MLRGLRDGGMAGAQGGAPVMERHGKGDKPVTQEGPAEEGKAQPAPHTMRQAPEMPLTPLTPPPPKAVPN